MDAVLPPGRHPVHLVDGLKGLLAKILVVNLDKPLVHAAKNHGRLTAPTVRVAVGVTLLMHQRGLFP